MRVVSAFDLATDSPLFFLVAVPYFDFPLRPDVGPTKYLYIINLSILTTTTKTNRYHYYYINYNILLLFINIIITSIIYNLYIYITLIRAERGRTLKRYKYIIKN